MADLIQSGADWLSGVMQAKVANEITYTRGAYTATFDATTGATEFVSEDETGIHVKFETRDFIFPVADLVLNSAATLPQRNDRITQTVNGTTKAYKVFSPSGERAYRFTDPGQKQIRVHTELVELP